MEVDPIFEPYEPLYMRIPPQCCTRGELDQPQMAISCIVFPCFSVNRGKYSKPEDVIKSKPHYGIVTFLVSDVPDQIPEDPSYTYRIEHDPLHDNHAHTEVRTYKDGIQDRNRNHPGRSVRMKFRAILFDRMKILRFPQQPTA